MFEQAFRIMDEMGEKDKSIVFCRNQAHAAVIRDFINQRKKSKELDFCVRVTANDGEAGEQFLREFQDDERAIPTILTTSQKLSTGVDAPNCRNIVLFRPINSIIEFKQIIGRGTRLFAGKDFFTIYDFVKAYHHFEDPEWDGEPIEPEPHPPAAPKPPGLPIPSPGPDGPDVPQRPLRLVIKLGDGKYRTIQHMSSTSFWSPDGKPMSATQFIESLFGMLPTLFKDEDELRQLWSVPSTRSQLLRGLEEKGFGISQLEVVQHLIAAEKSDLFDVLAYIRFALPPISRQARADGARPSIQSSFTDKQQAFLSFVLDHYVAQGTKELDDSKLSQLVDLRYGSMHDARVDLGENQVVRNMFIGFQKYLYINPGDQQDSTAR
jgi:type I restriction enzyme R subunit